MIKVQNKEISAKMTLYLFALLDKVKNGLQDKSSKQRDYAVIRYSYQLDAWCVIIQTTSGSNL